MVSNCFDLRKSQQQKAIGRKPSADLLLVSGLLAFGPFFTPRAASTLRQGFPNGNACKPNPIGANDRQRHVGRIRRKSFETFVAC